MSALRFVCFILCASHGTGFLSICRAPLCAALHACCELYLCLYLCITWDRAHFDAQYHHSLGGSCLRPGCQSLDAKQSNYPSHLVWLLRIRRESAATRQRQSYTRFTTCTAQPLGCSRRQEMATVSICSKADWGPSM